MILIGWNKVRDAILMSDICDVEEGTANPPEDTIVHDCTTVGDIIEVVKQEIERQNILVVGY